MINACADPEVGGMNWIPPEKSQIYRVPSKTGPDTLKIQCWADDGLPIVVLSSSLPSSTKKLIKIIKKNLSKLDHL